MADNIQALQKLFKGQGVTKFLGDAIRIKPRHSRVVSSSLGEARWPGPQSLCTIDS